MFKIGDIVRYNGTVSEEISELDKRLIREHLILNSCYKIFDATMDKTWLIFEEECAGYWYYPSKCFDYNIDKTSLKEIYNLR